MSLTAIYSNNTWGTISAITDGTDTVALPERVDGVFQWPTRKQTRQENPPRSITVSHPDNGGRTETLSVQFEPLTLTVIPEKWLEWVADGLITDQLLAAVPEPDDIKAARLLAEAKAAGEPAVKEWFDSKSAAGITIADVTLKGTVADATQYQAEISIAVSMGIDPVVSDVNNDLVKIPLADVGTYVATYHTKLTNRRVAADTANKTIRAATTVDEVAAALAELDKVE